MLTLKLIPVLFFSVTIHDRESYKGDCTKQSKQQNKIKQNKQTKEKPTKNPSQWTNQTKELLECLLTFRYLKQISFKLCEMIDVTDVPFKHGIMTQLNHVV